MAAALAAGVGGRLFSNHLEAGGESVGVRAVGPERGGKAEGKPVASLPQITEPRPEAAAVLAASGAARLRLLMAWLPGADGEELLQMAGEVVKTADRDNLDIRLLMARWAEVNPEAMVAWAEFQKPRMPGWAPGFYIANAIEAWARVDFEKAWTQANTTHRQHRRDALLGLTATDPGKCLALLTADPSLLSLSVGEPGYPDLRQVIRRLAGSAPQEVAALLDSAPAIHRKQMAGTLAEAWARKEPAAALAWMKTLPPDSRQSTREASEWIALHSPELLPALLEGLPIGGMRSSILATDLQRLAGADPAAARQRVETMPAGAARQYGRVILIDALMKTGDLAGAMEQADKVGWRGQNEWMPQYEHTVTSNGASSGYDYTSLMPGEVMKALIRKVAATNSAEAARILTLPNISVELMVAATRDNPAALATALASRVSGEYPPGNSMESWDPVHASTTPVSRDPAADACRVVIGSWAARDPSGVAAWVDSQPAGNLSTELATALFDTWAYTDPGAMVEWASRRNGMATPAWEKVIEAAPDYAVEHLDAFLAQGTPASVEALFSSLDAKPLQARELVKRLPDNSSAEFAGVMGRWLGDNAEEASAWVASLPEGEKRDKAAAEVAGWSFYQEKDYEAAAGWALQLPEETRGKFLLGSLRVLLEENPAKATALLQASRLSAEERQAILKEAREAPLPGAEAPVPSEGLSPDVDLPSEDPP